MNRVYTAFVDSPFMASWSVDLDALQLLRGVQFTNDRVRFQYLMAGSTEAFLSLSRDAEDDEEHWLQKRSAFEREFNALLSRWMIVKGSVKR